MTDHQASDPSVPSLVGANDSHAAIEALLAKSKRIKSDIEETNRQIDAVVQSITSPPIDDPKTKQKNAVPPTGG